MKNRRSFIIGLKSTVLQSIEIRFLKKYKPWGVILFSRNIKSIEQTKKLTDDIKKIFNDRNYPILIDQVILLMHQNLLENFLVIFTKIILINL